MGCIVSCTVAISVQRQIFDHLLICLQSDKMTRNKKFRFEKFLLESGKVGQNWFQPTLAIDVMGFIVSNYLDESFLSGQMTLLEH